MDLDEPVLRQNILVKGYLKEKRDNNYWAFLRSIQLKLRYQPTHTINLSIHFIPSPIPKPTSITGRTDLTLELPHIPGDEGVGKVVETGKLVSRVERGDRVVFNQRLLGTWRQYGIYDEKQLHIIPRNIPLPEASMLTCIFATAHRLLQDFENLRPGETVIQSGANSAVGQCVIQLCRSRGINTINFVVPCEDYEDQKEYLLSLGATCVCTLEEAVAMNCYCPSILSPKLALNSLGGVYECVLWNLLQPYGTMVHYGDAQSLPTCRAKCSRPDIKIHKFDIYKWYQCARCLDKSDMISVLARQICTGELVAPRYQPVELKNYVHALKHTFDCEGFSSCNYVFDLTLLF